MRDLERGLQLASRYTLVRKLGRGRGTEAWLATDRMTRASVVLKIAVDRVINAEQLRREWQLALRLVHSHIVRVFEFHDDDVAFYTQQYIDGADASVLAGLSPAEVLAPIALILDALAYAHGKNVVHRDIKAGNILIDANGSPYLIDFGVAASGDDDVGGGSLIATSPALLRGDAPVPADDIFALGGLIYELISGHSPYRSDSTREDIESHVPPPLTAAGGGEISPAIVTLVASMLDKDAGRRPDAMSAKEQLIAAGIEPGPVAAAHIGRPRGAGDEVISTAAVARRPRTQVPAADVEMASGDGLNPRIVAGALAALLLLLVGVVFFLPDAVEHEADPPAAATVDAAPDTQEALPPATTDEPPARDERVQARADAEQVLGQLLAKIRTLEARAVPRWGGLAWKQADEAYKQGDAEYLARNYVAARAHYTEALELVDPLLDQVDIVFGTTMRDAEDAFENAEVQEAIRLYDLAVAISPSHAGARAGLTRARNLDAVLALTEQALAHERDLELEAALASFEQAIEVDPEWSVAVDGRARVLATIKQMQFDARMTEGLNALADRDYRAARAAFQRARELQPQSQEPLDGLQAVEQEIRLGNIAALERRGREQESGERWQAAIETYTEALELDSNLTFAHEGLARATRMQNLHEQLERYIDEPDSLSAPRTMQTATSMLLDITRMPDIGPRLASQRDELSRLLKRAATPLTVELVSDNATDVSIYKVGKLGAFDRTELSLRPGTYVAVGSRPGFRDVRLEFRVAPEIDMQPVIVRCEERI